MKRICSSGYFKARSSLSRLPSHQGRSRTFWWSRTHRRRWKSKGLCSLAGKGEKHVGISREFPTNCKLLKGGVDRMDVLSLCGDSPRCSWQVPKPGLCSGNVPKLCSSESGHSPRQDFHVFLYLFGSFVWFFKKAWKRQIKTTRPDSQKSGNARETVLIQS